MCEENDRHLAKVITVGKQEPLKGVSSYLLFPHIFRTMFDELSREILEILLRKSNYICFGQFFGVYYIVNEIS
jgi:hypothetical protein